MLEPCNPCVCSRAPCEQCMFGYNSRKINHELMKKLLLAVDAGEKPDGWRCAETYKIFHRNWKAELEDEI